MKPSPARPEKTVADYLVMAVAPALIMGMVGSLMLFLVEAAYRGPFDVQVRWTLCWFVLAAVLVSRIAIQQGTSYATLYGLALGAATAFRLSQFIGLNLGALVLIALLWWCASKLTWDCTLIDDDTDASGEGLLDRAGLNPADTGAPPALATSPGTSPPSPSKPPHAPGLWVLYFSLGALPVFGLGQIAIPLDDPAARFRAFLFLGLYLASALALLFTTSFLGLRRYLRQRHLVMPAPVARLWLTFGTAATAAVLLGALFLPRPEAADTLAGLIGRPASSPSPDAAQVTWAGNNDENDKPAPGEIDDREAEQPVDEAASVQAEEGRRTGDQQVGPSPMTPAGSADLTAWLRWLTLAAGILFAIVLLIRFGSRWLQAIKRIMPRRKKTGHQPAAQPTFQPRPFAAYPNPFITGRAARMSPAELTTYTFEALQAWATEHSCGRRPEQTPAEFGRALIECVPTLSDEVLGTVRLYQCAAYAPDIPSSRSLEVLERLWSGLTKA